MIRFFLALSFLFLSFKSFSFETQPQRKEHVFVSLVSEYEVLSRQIKDFKIAVKFNLDPEWHIYWKNPGDSGTAPKATFTSNSDLEFGDFFWPTPYAIPVSPLLNYGYENEVLLPLNVQIRELKENRVLIQGELQWLVCKVECIPGKAEIDMAIPVKPEEKLSSVSNKIYKAMSEVPIKNHDIKMHVDKKDGFFNFAFDSENIIFSSFSKTYFFPENGTLINHTSPQEMSISKDNILTLKVPMSESLNENPEVIQGVLALERKGEPRLAFELSSKKTVMQKMQSSYIALLFFAFVGGMILNLMPCVFPVISIKILSFIQNAKDTQTKPSTHGWFYTFGVIVSFFILSGLLLILRSAGENLGWGFQLQSPIFIISMVILFFLIGLNLIGLFEVTDRFAGIGSGFSSGKDLKSSFFSGVLATLVATPCTAPFMGTALGVAVTLPALPSIFIFLTIGIGMAFPYLLLTYLPGLANYLPKPGLWMKHFKEFLSFPMFATVIWLLWVLSYQVENSVIIFTLCILLYIFLSIWILKINKRKTTWISLLIVTAFFFYKFISYVYESPKAKSKDLQSQSVWRVYSEKEIADLRKNKKPYFIDFTAAWCITCQVNKRLVLNTSEIQDSFKKNSVTLFVADWTNEDPVITQALEKWNRNSVPLYILYNPKSDKEVVLPEILTQEIVEKSLEQL